MSALRLETSKESREGTDERLVAYFDSADEQESQEHLEYLLETVARPIINRIVQRSARLKGNSSGSEPSVQDVASDALMKVLMQLREAKSNPRHPHISNFNGLVATITYRTVADQLRRKNRQRTNLERKIRRLFAANKEVLIWEDWDRNLVCGYVDWRRDETKSPTRHNEYPNSSEVLLTVTEVLVEPRKINTGQLILQVLEKVKRPIKLKDLVGLILEVTAAQHPHRVEFDSEPRVSKVERTFLDPRENRLLLKRLFAEMQKLEIQQRQALLLNMTDSYGYSIEWFLFTGIASEEELANLLDLSIDEFKRLLNNLPMTDKEIAKQLQISPTKVANIRKAVRERLARCRQAFLRGE